MGRDLWETEESRSRLGELLCVSRRSGSHDSIRRKAAKADAPVDMGTMEDFKEPLPESETKRGHSLLGCSSIRYK